MAIKLTKAEQNIYELAMFGYSVAQMADHCEITTGAIKKHLSHIYIKRGVTSRAELMAKEIFRLHNELRLLAIENENLNYS